MKVKTNSEIFVRLKLLPKEVWIGWISSFAEAYNMSIYSFTAPFFAPLLFNQNDPFIAVLFSYILVLIGSCFLYPLGAIYYGLVGDREGRQKICMYSTLGLAIATGAICFVPIQFLGSSAWFFFLFLICVQHFFSGGEYQGSIVFSLEHGEGEKSGLMSSMSCLFAVFGLVVANGLASLSILMKDEWMVRMCFFIGGLGGIISYILKNYCRETPAFRAIFQQDDSEKLFEEKAWFSFTRLDWRKMSVVIPVFAFFIVSYTFIFIFLPLVDVDEKGLYEFDTLRSLVVYGFSLIVAGWVADRIGMEKTIKMGLSLFSVGIIPLIYLVKDLFVLQIFLVFFASFVIAPVHSWMLCQFDVKKRCRSIFFCSAISMSFFWGSTVPICLMIYEITASRVICSLYPWAIGCISLLALKAVEKEAKMVL